MENARREKEQEAGTLAQEHKPHESRARMHVKILDDPAKPVDVASGDHSVGKESSTVVGKSSTLEVTGRASSVRSKNSRKKKKGVSMLDEVSDRAKNLRKLHFQSGTSVCLLSGEKASNRNTEALVQNLSKRLTAKFGDEVHFITLGLQGIQQLFVQSAKDSSYIYNIMPDGKDSGFGKGKEVPAGSSETLRDEIYPHLGDVYILIEGGPEAAQMARLANARGAWIIPMSRCAGASAGEHGLPESILEAPAWASADQWFAIGHKTIPVQECADAVADMIREWMDKVKEHGSSDDSEVWENERVSIAGLAQEQAFEAIKSYKKGAMFAKDNACRSSMARGIRSEHDPDWISRISVMMEMDYDEAEEDFMGDEDFMGNTESSGTNFVPMKSTYSKAPVKFLFTGDDDEESKEIGERPVESRISMVDKKVLWQVAAHEVIDEKKRESNANAVAAKHSLIAPESALVSKKKSLADKAIQETRKSCITYGGTDERSNRKSRITMDAKLAQGMGGGGYGTVGDKGMSQAVRKFLAATVQNGWQVICSGEADDFDDADMKALARRGYANLKSLLGHGGTAVVRVGVRDTNLKLTGNTKAMFQTLVPGSHMSMKDDWVQWNKPIRAKVLAEEIGAEEEYKKAVEERMDLQLSKMQTILAACREDIPSNFGAIWVMTMMEAESKPEDCQKPPVFGLASFRYLGEDEFAMGAGGRGANVATMALKQHLEKRVTKLNLESVDYGPTSEPHPTLSALYVRAFGFASKVLGKEKLAKADGRRESLSKFVMECKHLLNHSDAPSKEIVDRCMELIAAYDAGDSELDGNKVWILVKFAEKYAGGAKSRNEAKQRKKDLEDAHHAADQARWAYNERQEGPDAIPNHGDFSLDHDRLDPMLPVFFDDMLMRGRWLLFRMESDDDSKAKYRVAPCGIDDGTFLGGSSLGDEFEAWQAAQPTADGKPLRLANLDSMPTHKLRTARTVYNQSRIKRFNEAVEALAKLEQAQTLAVIRFQGPLENNEEACLPRPVLYDLPTTWASKNPEPRVTVSLKALKIKCWLQVHKVLHSNFLKDADPTNLPTYEEAVKKSRGR